MLTCDGSGILQQQLFDAMEAFESGDARADEHIRNILGKSTLSPSLLFSFGSLLFFCSNHFQWKVRVWACVSIATRSSSLGFPVVMCVLIKRYIPWNDLNVEFSYVSGKFHGFDILWHVGTSIFMCRMCLLTTICHITSNIPDPIRTRKSSVVELR